MIPLKTLSPVYSPPVVTWALIGLNVAVFLWMRGAGEVGFQRKVYEYSAVPQNIVGHDFTFLMLEDGEPLAAISPGEAIAPLREDFVPELLRQSRTRDGRFRYSYEGVPVEEVSQKLHPWLTILSAMFMHAGWMHLIFNMWALLVFGPNVEDVLGKLWYLVFYLATGVAAMAAQMLHDPNSVIPTLGASGAISGVMGGLAMRFPGIQVLTLIPIFLYSIAHLSVWVFMLIYLGSQIFWSMRDTQANGGVAWWAHIGGFVAGYFLIRVLPIAPRWRSVFARPRSETFS